METLYNNGQQFKVTIYAGKYSKVYIPKSVFNAMQDKAHSEVNAVDVYADKTALKIIPNDYGEFTLCRNGSSPNGRVITLNRQAIVKYSISGGHYFCDVENDGSLFITLERRENDA